MRLRVAIACGGTGGHLFPGLVVGEELMRRGAEVLLLVSPKEVDQTAVKSAMGMHVSTLPAVGWARGRRWEFLKGFRKSWGKAIEEFRHWRPQAVLAMGGFTAVPPVLAGRSMGAVTFLHESNRIAGKANRWLGHVVDRVFVGFPEAAGRLWNADIRCTGTPVRRCFEPGAAAGNRQALGLDPDQPVLLVMGGSQGAGAINDWVLRVLPSILARVPRVQILHLAGMTHQDRVREAYESYGLQALVYPFLTEMELALGAATVAISRAGASSLAEFAAMRLPSILIPFPAATDHHQYWNARAFVDSGAAFLLEEGQGRDDALADLVVRVLTEENLRTSMQEAMKQWHQPEAAGQIADGMIDLVRARSLWQPGLSAESN